MRKDGLPQLGHWDWEEVLQGHPLRPDDGLRQRLVPSIDGSSIHVRVEAWRGKPVRPF